MLGIYVLPILDLDLSFSYDGYLISFAIYVVSVIYSFIIFSIEKPTWYRRSQAKVWIF